VAVGQLKPLNTIGLALDPSFLNLVAQLRDAKTSQVQLEMLDAIYAGYGTHVSCWADKELALLLVVLCVCALVVREVGEDVEEGEKERAVLIPAVLHVLLKLAVSVVRRQGV